jgi:hypothetical protein
MQRPYSFLDPEVIVTELGKRALIMISLNELGEYINKRKIRLPKSTSEFSVIVHWQHCKIDKQWLLTYSVD